MERKKYLNKKSEEMAIHLTLKNLRIKKVGALIIAEVCRSPNKIHNYFRRSRADDHTYN